MGTALLSFLGVHASLHIHGYKNNVEKSGEREGERDEKVKKMISSEIRSVYFSPHLKPEGRRQVGPSLTVTMNIYSRFEERAGIGWDYTYVGR